MRSHDGGVGGGWDGVVRPGWEASAAGAGGDLVEGRRDLGRGEYPKVLTAGPLAERLDQLVVGGVGEGQAEDPHAQSGTLIRQLGPQPAVPLGVLSTIASVDDAIGHEDDRSLCLTSASCLELVEGTLDGRRRIRSASRVVEPRQADGDPVVRASRRHRPLVFAHRTTRRSGAVAELTQLL